MKVDLCICNFVVQKTGRRFSHPAFLLYYEEGVCFYIGVPYHRRDVVAFRRPQNAMSLFQSKRSVRHPKVLTLGGVFIVPNQRIFGARFLEGGCRSPRWAFKNQEPNGDLINGRSWGWNDPSFFLYIINIGIVSPVINGVKGPHG